MDIIYLNCQREIGNLIEIHLLSVLNGATIVGDMPHRISATCLMFLQLGGNIDCTVIESINEISKTNIFVMCNPLSKFMKIMSHKNLESYGSSYIKFGRFLYYIQVSLPHVQY